MSSPAQPDTSGRLARAVMWGGVNTILSRVVNLVMTAVVVHIVTPDEFGTFAIALAVFTVISGLSELGLTAVLARRDLDPDETGPTAAALAVAGGLVLGAAMYFGAGPLAVALGAPDAADPLRVLSITVVLIGLFSPPVGLILREYRQGSMLVATLVSFVPSNVLLVVMALQGEGAMAFAWSRVVGQLVMGVLLVVAARKIYWPRIDRTQLRFVAAFAFSVGGANLVRYVLLNADYLFVSRILGPASVGVYMLAFNVGSWATSVLSGMINGVALPAFSQDNHDRVRMVASFRSAVQMVSLIGFPISALTAALAEPIVRILYGEKWLAAVPVLASLTIYGSLFALTLVLGNVLMATGRGGTLLVLQLVWLAVLVPAMVVGIEVSGVRGAADAHVLVILFIMFPVHAWVLRREVPHTGAIMLRAAALPVLMAAVAGALAFVTSLALGSALAQLLVGGLVGGTAYLLMAMPLLRPFVPGRLATALARPLAMYDASAGRVVNPVLARFASHPGRP